MGIESGRDQQGQLVWKFPDDTIVSVRLAIDSTGRIVPVPTGPGAIEAKQDDIIARQGELQETPSEYTELRRLKDLFTELQTVRIADAGNSTIDNLGNGEVFTGAWLDALGYASAIIHIFADKDSATNGFQFQTSTDGINATHIHEFTVPANIPNGTHYVFTITARYYRVVYTNGTIPQTNFNISTTPSKIDITHSHTHPIEFPINGNHETQLVRSILTAKKPNDNYANIQATAGENLKISLEELETEVKNFFTNDILDKSAFGELLNAELTPLVQIDFPYNINADIVKTTITGSGTVTQADSKAVLQTTATTSSIAKLESKRFLNYNPGQGGLIRFTGVFTTGVANSSQILGIGDSNDGFFFGYNGTAFGILRRQNGVDNWTIQASWSEDQGDGNETLPIMDWTKGNVFQIRYQWLGFGMITFWVEDPATGSFCKVHEIEYANANTNPSIYNPSLPLMAFVENTTNNTNIKLQTSSMGAFVEGKESLLGPKNSISNTKAAITTTLTNVVTIRNRTAFASKTNRVVIELDFVSYSVDGTKPAIIKIVKNTTLGGSPIYADISTNTSVIEYDVAGTTLTGGQELFTFTIGKSDGDKLPLIGLSVDLLPGDTMTIAIAATSGTTDGTGSLSWIEKF